MEQVKISISLATGEVAIEAPASVLSEVFDRLESFVPRLRNAAKNSQAQDLNANDIGTNESAGQHVLISDSVPAKKAKNTKATSGKPESYKAVDLGLSPEQRTAFKDFYASKTPETQNDQLLVVIYWLVNNTNRDKVTMDEIFTGLRTVNAKIPKRISSVLSNLAIGAYISKESNEPRLLHVGEDHVLHSLPKKKS